MHCQSNQMMPVSAHSLQREWTVQILGLIVPILIMCVVWYSRFHLIVEMLNDIEAGVRNWLSSRKGKKQHGRAAPTGILAIKDPALAATVLLFSLAREAETLDPSHEDTVMKLVSDIVPTERLADCLTDARKVAGGVTDARDVVRRFKSLWRSSLDPAERGHLVAMAESVAGQSPSQIQLLCIASLREALAGSEKT